MKKLFGLLVIFGGALLLTGCGDKNTYTCSVTVTEGDESMKQEIITHLNKDGKVDSFDVTMTMETSESADTIYQLYTLLDDVEVTKSGKTVTIKDAQKIENSGLELVGKTKDEVKSYLLEIEPEATCK